MIYPFIGVRLHGWLDDLVVAAYLAGACFFCYSARASGAACDFCYSARASGAACDFCYSARASGAACDFCYSARASGAACDFYYSARASGAALGIAVFGALVHFSLTRLTRYPQGTWKLLSFRAHAFVELGEGIVVLAAALLLVSEPVPRLFLAVMGGLQFGAFAFSDYTYDPILSEKKPLGVRVDGHGIAPHE